jgi:cellulose synthase/poly-beta-1,6-N-acetylglucosamine synthase-like glycosyltransferase
MEIDESRMKDYEKPTLLQKMRNSLVSLLFGLFFLYITGILLLISFLPKILFYSILNSLIIALFLLGWLYGEDFRGFLHAKILNRWNPRDLFR